MSDPHFRTVFTSVRPQRVVTFVDRNDVEWPETCLRIIEFYSRTWGGNYNIIVPTDGASLSPTFWAVLDLFDPDYLYYYVKTGADLKASRPAEFETRVDREAQAWVQQNVPEQDWTNRRHEFDGLLSRAPFSDFRLQQGLQNDLKARLAPFYFREHVVHPGALTARVAPTYPLTAIKDIITHCDHAPYILIPSVADPAMPPLWWTSVLGATSPDFETEIQAAGLAFNNTAVAVENIDLLIAQVVAGRGLLQDETVRIADVVGAQLNRYRRYRRGEADTEPAMVLVVGDTLDDFCLYQCLSRMRGRVFWVQTSWLDSFDAAKRRAEGGGPEMGPADLHGHYFADQIFQLANEGDPTNIPILSMSLDAAALDDVSNRLDNATYRPGSLLRRLVQPVSIRDVVPEPYRPYEVENTGRDITKHVVDGELVGLFETPKPRKFDPVVPEHRWVAEVVIDKYQVPRHPELGTFFVRDHRLLTNGARAGAVGLAYACPNVGYRVGADIDSILIRPTVVLPSVQSVFEHLASTAQLRCSLSVKGVYELEAISKFSGLGKLGATFRDPVESRLLRKFVDNSPSVPGVHDEGVFLKSDGQRYLDLAAVAKVIGSIDGAIQRLDEYMSAGIVSRGLILKCTFCRSTDWFNLGSIDQRFQCKRCNRLQVVTSGQQVRPGEPTFFYKLDQLILRGLQNDMEPPVLALDWLRRNARDSFLATAEMDFFKAGSAEPFMECDICCFSDDAVVIGEGKKVNRLGRNAADERNNVHAYLNLARRLNAKKIVFATTDDAWSIATRSQIDSVFAGTSIRVDILERAQLFE